MVRFAPAVPEAKDDSKEMDKAAEEAAKELRQHFERWSARDVAAWWKTWYGRAGHKRLGRLLVDLARK